MTRGPEPPGEEPSDPEVLSPLPSATLLSEAFGTRSRPGGRGAHSGVGRELLSLAWPVMLSQLVVMVLSAADVAMVGRISAGHVAAVGFASQFFNLTQAMLMAIGIAGLALIARASGAGDTEAARRALGSALQLSVGTALLLSGSVLLYREPLLASLGAQPEVRALSSPYLALLVASLAPLSVSLVLENALRAEKNPRAPMWIAAGVAATKLLLNGLLVYGALGLPRLELVGAGIATLSAQLLGLACFLALVLRAPASSALRLRRAHLRPHPALLRQLFSVAAPGIGERVVMNGALLTYFRLLSDFGSVAVAAYTIGIRFLSFSWIPGTGLGTAASTLVGHALGANRIQEGESAGWQAMRLSLLVALAMGGLCVLFAGPLAASFARDPDLVAELSRFIVALGIMQPFLQSHFALGGAHRGAGDTWTPFLASSIGTCAVRVPLAGAAALGLGRDIRWLWGALVLDHVVRAAWMVVSFRRRRWAPRGDGIEWE